MVEDSEGVLHVVVSGFSNNVKSSKTASIEAATSLAVKAKMAAKGKASGPLSAGEGPTASYGLLALRPEDGAELWRQVLKAKPHKHDCNLLDVDQDGLKDCIVVGHQGLFAAINPKTGEFRSIL